MKQFTDCSGDCCICNSDGGCLAGHGDDYFRLASQKQLIERLDANRFPDDRPKMIAALRCYYGCDYYFLEEVDK